MIEYRDRDGTVVMAVMELWPLPIYCHCCNAWLPASATFAIPWYCGPLRDWTDEACGVNVCAMCFDRWDEQRQEG